MSRNEQLIRQQKILQILEASRFGKTEEDFVVELVSELGLDRLSRKTVRRDLEALQSAGYDIDVETSQGKKNVWKAGPRLKNLPKIPVSVTELLALSVGKELLLPLVGTPYWQGLESLWQKMRGHLPPAVWKHFQKVRSWLIVRGGVAKAYVDKEGILSSLHRAMLQHRRVRMDYARAGENRATPRTIEPLALAVWQGHIYLLADQPGDPARDEPRTFKLDRIRKVDVLDERFSPRGDFDAERLFEHSIGVFRGQEPARFRVQLDAELAAWAVETPFHPRQKVETHADGSLLITIDRAYPGEMIPRILGLGARAMVLEPLSCRDQIVAIAGQIERRYRSLP